MGLWARITRAIRKRERRLLTAVEHADGIELLVQASRKPVIRDDWPDGFDYVCGHCKKMVIAECVMDGQIWDLAHAGALSAEAAQRQQGSVLCHLLWRHLQRSPATVVEDSGLKDKPVAANGNRQGGEEEGEEREVTHGAPRTVRATAASGRPHRFRHPALPFRS